MTLGTVVLGFVAVCALGMVVYAIYLSALALTDLICGREEK